MAKSNRDTNALVDEFRQRALDYGKRVGRHGERLSEDLRKKLTYPPGDITNDTSPNLKLLIPKAGAFFSKHKRPKPLGHD